MGAKRMYDEDVWLYEINNSKHVWICRICRFRNPDEDECRVHRGSAPQVRTAAKRRLDQAADALVQKLPGFALDGEATDAVALQAIRDALDRAGLGAKQALGMP